MTHGPRWNVRAVWFAASLVVVVGLLTGACSSSAGPAGSSGSGTTTPVDLTSNWSKVDVDTGAVTPVPPSTATAGDFYVVSPDHSLVAFNPCCSWGSPARVANLDGTNARTTSAAGSAGVGEQWSPDGSLVVYQQREGGGNQLGNLYVMNVATRQRTRITNLNQTQNWGWWFIFPSFSPDGKSVLFQRPKGKPNDNNRLWDLWSAPVGGGKPTLVQRNAAFGSYSPNGTSLAYLAPMKRDFTGAGLWIRSVHGGTPRALVHGGSLRWVRWSPDGTRIAYTNGNAIDTVDPATGKITQVVANGDQPEWLDGHTLIFAGG